MGTETWAVAMVKDEADVIEHTVKRMLDQVDHILVADNGSTDGTLEILAAMPISIIPDPDPGFYQSEKMSRLAGMAMMGGAGWVVPFDADEVHLCRDGCRLADALALLAPEVLVSEAILFDHVATGQDPELDNPIRRLKWRRSEPLPLRKVACRASEGLVIHQGNHGASYPGVNHPPSVTNLVEVRHFPYRSPEQFERKVRNGAAAYAATDLPEDVGSHWRGYGRILEEQGPEALAGVYHKWFYRERPTVPLEIEGERQAPLVRDPIG